MTDIIGNIKEAMELLKVSDLEVAVIVFNPDYYSKMVKEGKIFEEKAKGPGEGQLEILGVPVIISELIQDYYIIPKGSFLDTIGRVKV